LTFGYLGIFALEHDYLLLKNRQLLIY